MHARTGGASRAAGEADVCLALPHPLLWIARRHEAQPGLPLNREPRLIGKPHRHAPPETATSLSKRHKNSEKPSLFSKFGPFLQSVLVRNLWAIPLLSTR